MYMYVYICRYSKYLIIIQDTWTIGYKHILIGSEEELCLCAKRLCECIAVSLDVPILTIRDTDLLSISFLRPVKCSKPSLCRVFSCD